MCTVTLEINECNKEAKSFLHYIEEFAYENDAVNIMYEPNEKTLKSFEDIEAGNVFKAKDAKDLFRQLEEEVTMTKLLNAFKTEELTQKEIDDEVETVRAELYAKNKKS